MRNNMQNTIAKKTYDLDDLKKYLDENQISNESGEQVFNGKGYKYIDLEFPIARDCERIRVYDDDRIESVIKSVFFKYRGISNYEAIWSSEHKCIECEVNEPDSLLSAKLLLRKLERSFQVCGNYENDQRVVPSEFLLYQNDNIKITIGYCSKAFAFLHWYKQGRRVDIENILERYKITLKIENIVVKTEDGAKEILEKISNSLFYQIDVLCDYSIILTSRRKQKTRVLPKIRKDIETDNEMVDLKLNYEYDSVPMAFYWFALNNVNSPIFMYFALYQVLEYYFPIFSAREAKLRIQNLVKDPKFDIESDEYIARLIDMAAYDSINKIGDEREQLDNVLRNIILGEEVIKFIEEREYLKDYYTSKNQKKISDVKLRLSDNIGIINDLSARIYDIRCRIVHNKASEINKKILPVTKDAQYLAFETELLRFIVQKAIIANSKSMRWK